MATTNNIVPSSLATLTPAAHPTRTQVVEALTLAATREGSGGFAAVMLHRVSNGQDLTLRMRDCIIDLTQREARRLNAATAAATAARLDASGICTMFDSARAHGAQRIAITLATAGGIRFGLSRNGIIYISDAAEFGNRNNYGRIMVGGSDIILHDDVAPEVALAIAAVAADPAAAIVRHGHLTGKCSFCCRPLTDGGSIAHGYGEVCAGKYGLPWNSTTNRALRSKVAAAATATPQPPHGE